MSEQRLAEVEQARAQARLAAEKSERIIEAQRVMHGEVPRGPPRTMRPPEAVPTRKVEVKELERIRPQPEPKKPETRPRPFPRRGRSARRRRFRFRIFGQGPLFGRQPVAHARLKEDTPANISRAEKDRALKRLDASIAAWSRKYAFRVVHGGTPAKKQEAAVRLRELQAERDAIAAMKPLGLPEHVRKAEFHE